MSLNMVLANAFLALFSSVTCASAFHLVVAERGTSFDCNNAEERKGQRRRTQMADMTVSQSGWLVAFRILEDCPKCIMMAAYMAAVLIA
jgi:hypothetical protein